MESSSSKLAYRGYFDGSYRKEANNAGMGAYLVNGTDEVIWECAKGVDAKTNNEAEYCALVELLAAAEKWTAYPLVVFGDSQLVIYQMQGVYRVKSKIISTLHQQATSLVGKQRIRFCWVERKGNKYADRMSKIGQKLIEHSGPDLKGLVVRRPLDPKKFKEIAPKCYVVNAGKGKIYLVDGINKACTCPGFLSRRYCEHLDAVFASIQ